MQRSMHVQRRRNERGASAVEFALVVPILIVMVFGIVNFGVVLAQQISLNNGARQAARYAVVDGRNCGQIKAQGVSGAETIGMVSTDVPTPVVTNCGADTVKPCSGTTTGSNITVTMTRSGAAWTIPFPPLFTSSTSPTLTGTGVMRCEFK